MSGRTRPGDRYKTDADMHWTSQAACTPDPMWTPEYKPRPEILQALRIICDNCPVQRDCAQHAITEKLAGGVYAGEWLPHRRYNQAWLHARAVLHRKTRPVTKGTA